MVNNRYCVQSCPSSQPPSTTLTHAAGTLTFTAQITSDGSSLSTPFNAAMQISYDSSVAFDRICLPSTAAFNNALKDYSSSFANLKEGELGNFILDIKNVNVL